MSLFFIPPRLSGAMSHPANLYSVDLFLVTGYLFSDTREHPRRAPRNTETALTETGSVCRYRGTTRSRAA